MSNEAQMKKEKTIPAYLLIARDVAGRIALGEIPEGERFSGRSLMSSNTRCPPKPSGALWDCSAKWAS